MANKALAEVFVAIVESLYAASGVHDALFSSVERVAFGADFYIVYRVGLAVFPLDCLIAGDGRASQERNSRC